jgi:adenylate cyclase
MRAKGLTDYVAWPLYHTLGQRHIVTFATDRRGGFDDAHIDRLLKLLPVLALVSEIRELARTLLETYVGSHVFASYLQANCTRQRKADGVFWMGHQTEVSGATKPYGEALITASI